MQDRSYAIALAVILAVCCLGAYVALSGFMNTRPPGAAADLFKAITPVSVILPTETTIPTKSDATLAPSPTSSPNPTPLGVIPTITALTTTATLAVPTFAVRPTSPLAPPSSVTQTCANYVFCPSGGPPDGALAPTGAQCPQNYIWGRIVDKNGKGISGVRVRFKNPMGNTDSVESKGPPDPPGIYNILSPPPGGSWLLWVLDAGGGQASPQYAIVAPQSFTGSGTCPTRVDFRAQR